MAVLAGIDIGTNTLRLLIARLDKPDELIELDSDRRITRLGEGMHREGKLSSGAVTRTVTALKEFKKKISNYKIDDLIVVGTSAVREAKNTAEFLSRVRKETGFEVQPISGIEEARRTFLGVLLGIGPLRERAVVMDIGGGSTEFITGVGGRPGRMVTIDLGAVTLTEKYLGTDPIASRDFNALRTEIESRLKPVCDTIAANKPFILIGTAGTITTLAAMDLRLERYDPVRINRYALKKTSVVRMLKDLLSKTAQERHLMPSLENGREDIIVAGAAVLTVAMEMLECNEIVVSEYGLREGVLLDLYLSVYEAKK
jgi:exopolyphosphatase/guanosine-5'-triphosphate,3'-diphosphate pyrophosphatase